MCSTFTPDCGFDNCTFILIGNVYCPNTECLGKLCLYKKIFQSLGRSDYQCPQCGSVCQVRNVPLKIKHTPFFVAWSGGLHFWREPKINSRCYWRCLLSWQVLSQQREIWIGGYVTTPRFIFGCGKCGAWLFVHKVPFTLQEHVKTTKTDKSRFFNAKKYELGTRQTIFT